MTSTRAVLLTILIFSQAQSVALAAGSGPAEPGPDLEIEQYNKGVQLLLKKKFSKAEKWFRKSLATRETFAEAHNNLAYTLRKQGSSRYAEALRHYDRAIELAPNLPEPYMYRGVLHVQMGSLELAEKDYERLRSLSEELADELAYVIETQQEKEPERFFGVSRELQ